ncbi:MAG: shikimate dehydrogenase [Treponema sp.]|jgi:shikimate 5-dehydrogenase|nr:shikimate dehydrogenase [Treponema sp.]
MLNLQTAREPTFYFIGVTTRQSSIMTVFPKWAAALGLKARIQGIDLPLHAPPEEYRKVIEFFKADPLSLGALVTTHKLDLFAACRDMFDYIDPYAQTLSEVSSLSKKDGAFCAHAKDPISSGLALEAFVPPRFWTDNGGEVLLLGAGGSSLAMSLYFSRQDAVDNMPRRITIANRSEPRLVSARNALEHCGTNTVFRFLHCPVPADNDALVAALPPYSLVVNATGLGKDAPGSPTTEAVSYPENSLVWEINYRGDLLFVRQAQGQQKTKRLHIENGWKYFIYGWTQVIAEVFHVVISGEQLEELSRIAQGGIPK